MDTIRLDGVRIMGRHGVFAEERTREQPFVVDVALHCDVRAAGTSDDLRLTIDYGAVAFVIRDVIEGESVQLIETLAERIESRHALFVFDSCFSGSLFALRASNETPAIVAEALAKPVRQFITSGSAKEMVPDQSVFRRFFVRGLEGEADLSGDGWITGTELGA